MKHCPYANCETGSAAFRLDWADVNLTLTSGYIEVKAAKAKSARRRSIKMEKNLLGTPERCLPGIGRSEASNLLRWRDGVYASGFNRIRKSRREP